MRNFRPFLRWLLLFSLSILVSCNASQRQALKQATWDAGNCSTFAALACAGQAVGGCSLEHSDSSDYAGFSDCLVDSTPSCIAKNVGRCLLSGIVKATGSLVFAGGGVGCTTPADVEDVKICVENENAQTEAAAVEAVAQCWQQQCSR